MKVELWGFSNADQASCTQSSSSYKPVIGVLKDLSPILASGELPCEGKMHRRYSHGAGSSGFDSCSYISPNEVFYGGRSANPASNLLERGNPTAGRCLQTQFGMLDMDDLWLTKSSSTL